MRAATKVSGLGAGFLGGLRGAAPAVVPAEQAMRKSPIPVSATVSSTHAAADVAPVQRPVSELDGWEFAGGEGDLVMTAGEPLPRVVFTGVASMDEAMKATVELKEALDEVYSPSPKFSESGELSGSDNRFGLSLISKPGPEMNSGLVVQAAPIHALKAFKLLSSITEVQVVRFQNVVASIASDPKVWTAVMHNSVLQEFLESNQKFDGFEESVPEKPEGSSIPSKAKQIGNWFMGKVENVVELVGGLSSKLQNIFGFAKEDEKESHVIGVGASLMGLATMVIMVVLFKRI